MGFDLPVNLHFKPPGPVAKAFMLSPAFVRGLQGPVGSAKSSTSIMEMLRQILLARAGPDGKKRSRWAVIRNTNPMLRTTTIKTYEDWLKPDVWGDIKMAPPPFVHEIAMDEVEAEVWFLSLDRPEDMRKLLSLELTGAFTNETRELSKTIIDGITQRLRRFPAQKDGGFGWSGLIMDTNAPDEDHWWSIMSGQAPFPEHMSDDERRELTKPADWEFFLQPPAMLEVTKGRDVVGYEINPDAENIQNLDPRYYPGMIGGKKRSWINVYVLNRLGSIEDGRAVQEEFKREVHVSAEKLEPFENVPFTLGVDFGLTPAAVLEQNVRGRWFTYREIVLEGASAHDMSIAINRVMATEFPNHKIGVVWGDPSGDNRSQADKKTPFQVMRAAGLKARPTETNDPDIRRIAGNAVLTRMTGGEPACVIDPSCRVLIAGLDGAWCYKRVRGAGDRFDDEPSKNRFSHVCEAWEYSKLGGGEARSALGRQQNGGKVVQVARRSTPLARMRGANASTRSNWKPMKR
jgi:hypothetical protein